MSTLIGIEGLEIKHTDIRPYGWFDYPDADGRTTLRGHEFDLAIKLSLRRDARSMVPHLLRSDPTHAIIWREGRNWSGMNADPRCAGMPHLEWLETVRYYNVQPNGTWTPAGTHQQEDMFRRQPRARTWGTFYPGSPSLGSMGWADPWTIGSITRGNPRPLTSMPRPQGFDVLAFPEKAYTTAQLHRDTRPLEGRITDRPAMQNQPVPGATVAGGIRPALADTPSRSRVVHFDIGFAGSHLPRVHATQILETQAGVPTICKFINAFCHEAVVCSPANHARWRLQLVPGPIRAASLFNYSV